MILATSNSEGAFMINAKNIDNVYALYKCGVISKKRCVNLLLSFLKENPYFFGLEKLNEESICDFMFYIFPKIQNGLESYDEGRSYFSSYFQSLVRLDFITWKKIKIKEKLRQQAIINIKSVEYEIEEDFIQNTDFLAAEPEQNPYQQRIEISEKLKLELYIIILKSAYYISSEQLSDIVEKFSLDFNELQYLLFLTNEQIKKKIENAKLMEELVNWSFIKREEVKICMSHYSSEDPIYEKLLEDYQKIDERYNQRKEKLKKMKIVPSDITIAKILGISASKVRYTLKKNYQKLNIAKTSRKK